MTIEREVKIVEAEQTKKDVKGDAKTVLSKMVVSMLEEAGIKVRTDHDSFGFTRGTVLVEMPDTDVQVKLITPKAGTTRYAEVKVTDEVSE